MLSHPPFTRLHYFWRSEEWVDEPVFYTWADAKFISGFNAALHYHFRVAPGAAGYSLEAFAVSLALRHPLSQEEELLANAFLDLFERHFSANFARLRAGLRDSKQSVEVPFRAGVATTEVVYHPERGSDFLTLTIRDGKHGDR